MINIDVFAWSPLDIPGVVASVICHHLNVNLTCRSVKQKRQNIRVEKQ